jgi:hypothetical protein
MHMFPGGNGLLTVCSFASLQAGSVGVSSVHGAGAIMESGGNFGPQELAPLPSTAAAPGARQAIRMPPVFPRVVTRLHCHCQFWGQQQVTRLWLTIKTWCECLALLSCNLQQQRVK